MRASGSTTAFARLPWPDAIGAVYLPADFDRDIKAEPRPQVVAFYNQQFLTAAGIASGFSDSLTAAAKRAAVHAASKASRIGSLVAETLVLVNPQRNYAQFLLRAAADFLIRRKTEKPVCASFLEALQLAGDRRVDI